jgi:hypothetical protein
MFITIYDAILFIANITVEIPPNLNYVYCEEYTGRQQLVNCLKELNVFYDDELNENGEFLSDCIIIENKKNLSQNNFKNEINDLQNEIHKLCLEFEALIGK